MARGSSKASSGRARSAITGRYVKPSTARAHPKTTVVEKTSSKGGKKK